jgi:CelD/BcsL family acetyltransferase involved in cellulose biosynthesis
VTALPGLERIEIDDPRWTSFASTHAEASPFHHPAWARLLADCYGFDAFAVGAFDGDEPIAGMPLLEVSSHRSRRRWVSLPYTDYCPPLLGGCLPSDFGKALEHLRQQAGVEKLELRGSLAAPSVRTETVAYRHVLPVDPDPERLFTTFQKSRVQRGVRQAERFAADGLLAVKRADCEADVTEEFFDLHVSTRRRLGVPVQPRRFFRLLWERMLEPGLGFALLAQSGDKSVAGAVFLFHGRTMVYKFGASERDAQRLRPNHLLMWTAIREACERGLDVFDFGRTDLSGDSLREFKLGWGTTEEPLVYSFLGAETDHRTAGRAAAALAPLIRRSPRVVCRTIGELFYKRAA